MNNILNKNMKKSVVLLDEKKNLKTSKENLNKELKNFKEEDIDYEKINEISEIYLKLKNSKLFDEKNQLEKLFESIFNVILKVFLFLNDLAFKFSSTVINIEKIYEKFNQPLFDESIIYDVFLTMNEVNEKVFNFNKSKSILNEKLFKKKCKTETRILNKSTFQLENFNSNSNSKRLNKQY